VRFSLYFLMIFLLSGLVSAKNISSIENVKPKRQVLISLKEQVMVEGLDYRLEDIADIRTSDEALNVSLRAIVVGQSPRIGYVEKIRQIDLLPRIEKAFPGIYSFVTWNGPKYSRVQSIGVSYQKENIESIAQNRLSTWLIEKYKNFSIKVKGHVEDLVLPKGKVRLDANISNEEKLSKRMSVWVDVYVNDRHYQSVPIWFAVQVEAPVIVIAKDAKRGMKVLKNYLTSDLVDIAGLKGTPVTLDDLEHKRLKRDVKAGEVITDTLIESVPDVVAGSEVVVTASSGGVTIHSSVIALDDGMIGDRVRVNKPNSSVSYKVTVTGRNKGSVDGDNQ